MGTLHGVNKVKGWASGFNVIFKLSLIVLSPENEPVNCWGGGGGGWEQVSSPGCQPG